MYCSCPGSGGAAACAAAAAAPGDGALLCVSTSLGDTALLWQLRRCRRAERSARASRCRTPGAKAAARRASCQRAQAQEANLTNPPSEVSDALSTRSWRAHKPQACNSSIFILAEDTQLIQTGLFLPAHQSCQPPANCLCCQKSEAENKRLSAAAFPPQTS